MNNEIILIFEGKVVWCMDNDVLIMINEYNLLICVDDMITC